MNKDDLDPGIVRDVIDHMNSDHADACLAIAGQLGGYPDSASAVMQHMDRKAAEFSVTMLDGSKQLVRVAFDAPITRDQQIRGYLVALTRRARASLHQ